MCRGGKREEGGGGSEEQENKIAPDRSMYDAHMGGYFRKSRTKVERVAVEESSKEKGTMVLNEKTREMVVITSIQKRKLDVCCVCIC